MCESWARMLLAQADVDEKGLTIRVGDGTPTARPIRNPSLVTLEKASNEYRTWAAEFGLTPSSEGRLGIRETTPQANNPFAPKEKQA